MAGKRLRRVLSWIGASAILLVAGSYWAAFLERGAPFVYHPDEPAIMARAIRMVVTGDLNPHWFHYPSFYLYLQAAIVQLVHAVTRIPLAPGAELLFEGARPEVVPYYEWGRVATIAFALGTTALVMAIASELAGKWSGLFAGALFVASTLVLESAVYVTVDMPMTFLVTFSTWLMIRLLGNPSEAPKLSSYWLVAAAGGLAGGAKYNGCLVLPALAGLVVVRRGLCRRAVWEIASCAAVAVAAFVLTTPYFLLDPGRFWDRTEGLPAEFVHYATGHLGADTGSSVVKAAEVLFHATGPFGLLALVGMFRAARAGRSPMRSRTLLLLGVLALLGTPVGIAKVFFPRNCVPLLPPIVALSASGLRGLSDLGVSKARGVEGKRTAAIAFAAFTMVLQLWFGYGALAPSFRARRLADTRTAAEEWFEGHVPAGATVLREAFTPHLHLLPAYEVNSVFSLGALPEDRIAGAYDYVVTSSFMWSAYPTLSGTSYAAVFSHHLVYESPADGSQTGPVIRIYEMRPELPADLESRLVFRMSEQDGFSDVYPLKDVALDAPEPGRAGPLALDATGDDPTLLLPPAPAAGSAPYLLHVIIDSPARTVLQLFYATKEAPSFAEERSVRAPLSAGRNEIRVRFGPAELEGPIRLDPGQVPGSYSLRLLALYRL